MKLRGPRDCVEADAGWTPADPSPAWNQSTYRMAAQRPSGISSEQLARLIRSWPAEHVLRFTASTPDTDRHSAIDAAGLDLLDARLRQVVFFDTPDLTLTRRGITLWASRIQRRPASAGITFHPWGTGRLVAPDQAVADVPRDLHDFEVEVDAVPGGYACAATGGQRLTTSNSKTRSPVDGPSASCTRRISEHSSSD